jgi:hypothetical protein
MENIATAHEISIFERLIVSPESASAVLALRFSEADEARMQQLLGKNNQGTITAEERSEMEAYCRIGSFLAILQAKAKLQLRQSDQSSAA